jgi:hypothetical protein
MTEKLPKAENFEHMRKNVGAPNKGSINYSTL